MTVNLSQRVPRYLVAAIYIVVAVHQHFGFDYGDETRLLSEGGVTSEGVSVYFDAVRTWKMRANRDDGAPLGEPRPDFVVLGHAAAQTVKPFGDYLARRARERVGPGVHLDAGYDPALFEQFDHGCSVRAVLSQRFVVQNHAAYELRRAFGADEHFAVVAPFTLHVFDAERGESRAYCAGALVGGKYALTGCDESFGCLY